MSSHPAPAANRRTLSLVTIAAGVIAALVLAFVWTGRNQTPKPAITDPGQNGSTLAPRASANADQPAAILQTAEKLRAQGDGKKAEAMLRTASQAHPNDQSLAIGLAEFLVADRQLEDAYASYARALAIGPPDAVLEFAAGTVANMLGRSTQAIEHYSAAQSADKSDPRYPLYLAQIQAKENLVTEAKANLLIAAKLDPDNAVVWGTLADLSLRANQASLALQHVRKARALQPEATVWRVIEARALKRENKPEEALGVLIGLSPNQRLEPGVLQTMAECYGLIGDNEAAAGLYAAATQAEPMDGALTLEHALWVERAGRPDDALKIAERAALLLAKGAPEVVARLKKQ